MGSRSSREEVPPPPRDLRDALHWSKNDVGIWLEEAGYEKYRFKFLSQDIDGPALMELNEEHLDRLGVSIGHSLKILRLIQSVDKSEMEPLMVPPKLSPIQIPPEKMQFQPKQPISPALLKKRPMSPVEEDHAITVVLKKMNHFKNFDKMTTEQKRERAKNVVIRSALTETYLNLNYVKTRKVEDDEITDSSSFDEITSAESETISAIGRSAFSVTPYSYLKVKLVIVEIHHTSAQKTIRRLLSPLIDSFGISRYGMFHSALIVGPWYLEWNDSGLVIPRMCYAGAAILAADVDKYFKGPQVDVAVDKIASVISHWNSGRQYSSTGDNCQTFIDELCAVLDIQLDFKGALGNFIQTLRKTGQCEPTYTCSSNMQKLLGIREPTRKFETHADLDTFVNHVRQKMPTYFDMDEVGKDDWMLLKSYDRAFWLRKHKEEENKAYHPHDCPFNDPVSSGSLGTEVFTYKKRNKPQ
jgi:hypothetical protein